MLFTFAMYPNLLGTSELKWKHLRKIVFFQSCFSNISSIQPRNRGSMLTSVALYPFDFFPMWVFDLVFKLSSWPEEKPCCLFVSGSFYFGDFSFMIFFTMCSVCSFFEYLSCPSCLAKGEFIKKSKQRWFWPSYDLSIASTKTK